MKKLSSLKSQLFPRSGIQLRWTTPKGFTLIELLIVIAVLGVLATVVLVAIDPAEQIRRADDAGRRVVAKDLLNALERFSAINGRYPWTRKSGGGLYSESCEMSTGWQSMKWRPLQNLIEGYTAFDRTSGSPSSWNCIDDLIRAGELKDGFKNSKYIPKNAYSADTNPPPFLGWKHSIFVTDAGYFDNPSDATGKISICFRPVSKSLLTNPDEAKYNSDGTSAGTGGTCSTAGESQNCFICVFNK